MIFICILIMAYKGTAYLRIEYIEKIEKVTILRYA